MPNPTVTSWTWNQVDILRAHQCCGTVGVPMPCWGPCGMWKSLRFLRTGAWSKPKILLGTWYLLSIRMSPTGHGSNCSTSSTNCRIRLRNPSCFLPKHISFIHSFKRFQTLRSALVRTYKWPQSQLWRSRGTEILPNDSQLSQQRWVQCFPIIFLRVFFFQWPGAWKISEPLMAPSLQGFIYSWVVSLLKGNQDWRTKALFLGRVCPKSHLSKNQWFCSPRLSCDSWNPFLKENIRKMTSKTVQYK